MVIVEVNTGPTVDSLNALRHRQLPFALSLALNRTAARAQAVQVAGMMQRFTVRRRTWMAGSVVIPAGATKRKPEVTIRVRDPELVQHEAGGIRRPGDIYSSLVNPVGPRERKRGIIRGANTPKALIASGKGVALRTKSGKVVIFRRSRSGLTPAFALERAVPLRPRLHFEETVGRVVLRFWQDDFRTAFAEANATAR